MARKHRIEPAAQVADLRDRLAPVVEHAAAVASEKAAVARDWAAPRVEHAVGTATERIQGGLERGLQVAAPRVEAAAGKVAPAVDAARDRIVEDLLPRVVEAVTAAAAAGAAARETAAAKASDTASKVGERASGAVEETALRIARSTPTARRRAAARRTKILVIAVFAAAIAAGAAAFKRSRGKDPDWDSAPTGSSTRTGAAETGLGAAASGPLSSGPEADRPGPITAPTPDAVKSEAAEDVEEQLGSADEPPASIDLDGPKHRTP